MADLSVYDRLNTLMDYQKANQEMALQKKIALEKLKTGGGNTPAALQLANEYQAAIANGDLNRANSIAAFAKTVDKNVYMSPEGQYVPLPGLPSALGQLEFGKESGTQQARDIYEPNRAGAVEQAKLGQQLVYEPQISSAKKTSDMLAEAQTGAQINLPKAQEQSKQILDLINSIEQDKGLSAVVGLPNPLEGRIPFIGNVAGSAAADFQAKLDQLGGKQFLEAFESLKGGGQITQIEGEKATNAIARMQTSQSEKAFKQALDELRQIVVRASDRAKQKAGIFNNVNPANPPNLPDPLQESLNAIQEQQAGQGVNPMQRPELMPPKPGAIVDGYVFLGGNPADPKSWKKGK